MNENNKCVILNAVSETFLTGELYVICFVSGNRKYAEMPESYMYFLLFLILIIQKI